MSWKGNITFLPKKNQPATPVIYFEKLIFRSKGNFKWRKRLGISMRIYKYLTTIMGNIFEKNSSFYVN